MLRHWGGSLPPGGRTRAIAALLQQTARVPALLDAIEQGAVEAAVIEVGARNRLLEETVIRRGGAAGKSLLNSGRPGEGGSGGEFVP
ncbi:MAG: hypothetical protein IPJ98_25620 [Bryobacterales bacterium]|nr:hypothetical protein [Bryobacterales bacterium]